MKMDSVLEDGEKVVDEEIYTYIKISQKDMTRRQRADQISKRLLCAFINEAAFCFEEGILRDTKSGDLGLSLVWDFLPLKEVLFDIWTGEVSSPLSKNFKDLPQHMESVLHQHRF